MKQINHLKILHVVPSYKPAYVYGGPIESVAKLCEGLVAAGHTVDVYTTTANGTTELTVAANKEAMVDGVSVTYFSRLTKDPTHISPALWKALYRHCRAYDVVHIHSWWNPLVIVAAMICHRQNVKVVISPRGMLSRYILTATNSKVKQLIHNTLGKKALTKAIFHATSEGEYEECKALIPGWKGFLLPNILSLPPIEITKQKNDAFTLLFLSRIHPKKGIELLIEALTQCDGVLLKIAGDGEESYIGQLQQKVKEKDLESRVQWLGWKSRDEKFKELMAADLFVLSSYNENFANVVVESLYVGTPVLVTEAVGLSQFVKRENLGWVVPAEASAISHAINNIKNQPQILHEIQQRSQSVILREFSERALIKKYGEEYEHLSSYSRKR